MFIQKTIRVVCFVLISASLLACINRNSPAFKEAARREDERRTKLTEKAISESPELQKLDKLCRELPLLEKFELLSKGMSKRKGLTLFYYYRSDQNFDELKKSYKEQLVKTQWEFLKEENGLEADSIEFKRDNYLIRISNGRLGEANYSTDCEYAPNSGS